MPDEMKLLSLLAPDLMADIGRRAQVLTGIESMQPVGRRALSARLNLPEREIRSAASALKEQGLICMDAAGMKLTSHAQDVLECAREVAREMYGLTALEKEIGELLDLEHVIIVGGASENDPFVLREVGRAAANRLHRLLRPGMTIAVGGGSTMSEVAHGMPSGTPMDVMVLPARGGMGTSVELQANTVASEIAHRIGGRHKAIHLPDNLDAPALQEMMRIPEIRETLNMLTKCDIVVHGVGDAQVMAVKRGLNENQTALLRSRCAVGEAFGDFFDFSGRTVFQAGTVTASVKHLDARLIAVAAGAEKARAIIAATRNEKHDSLITDESAARKICELLQTENPHN